MQTRTFANVMLIRASDIFTPLGIQNLNKKRKTNRILVDYSRFSHDVTTAMLVPLNKEKATMLVPRPNPPGI